MSMGAGGRQRGRQSGASRRDVIAGGAALVAAAMSGPRRAWSDEPAWAKIAEDARKEGRLVVYMGITPAVPRAVTKAF